MLIYTHCKNQELLKDIITFRNTEMQLLMSLAVEIYINQIEKIDK